MSGADAGGCGADGLSLCGRCDGSGLVPSSAVRARDDAADAYDVLVRRVWEAVTGDTHEGPANVEVLVEAVAGLRARAERAGAELDALRVAVQEYLRVGSTASYKALAKRVGLTVREG